MDLFKKKKKIKKQVEKDYLINKEVPFSIEEAYKSLRTNLLFSLPESNCKIIEITSSLQHEGKSVTAINLAIALSKNGAKVVLVDCDLRLPTVARKLRINQSPGLTNLLFGMNKADEILHHHSSGIDVIPAGDSPPNPSEVLGSSRMGIVIDQLSHDYDYVIIDSPPVGVVTDAVVLSKKVSGVVLVARRGISSIESINSAVETLKLANANILGFVLTDAELDEKTYSHYRHYGYASSRNKKR